MAIELGDKDKIAEFLKPDETVFQRLERGHRDEVMLMKLLVREKRISEGLRKMDDEQIKHMVGQFLRWKLPEDFHPDCGISFKRECNENTQWPSIHEPVGTNLFDHNQATAMVRYMLEGLPSPPST